MKENEIKIVSDLNLREGNDQLEGVEVQEALEDAETENVSKGTKDDLETIVKYLTFVYLQFKHLRIKYPLLILRQSLARPRTPPQTRYHP